MAAARCPACDERLPRGASWCPSCGLAAPGSAAAASGQTRATTGMAPIDVQAVEDPLADDGGEEIRIGGGGRWRAAAGIGAVVVALVAAGSLVSPSGETASDTTAAPSTSSTSRPTTTSSRVPRTTTTTLPLTRVDLPTAAAGRLFLGTGRGTVLIDLGSGAVTPLDSSLEAYPGGSSIVQLGDALVGVGAGEGTLRAVPLDGSPSRPFRADGYRLWGDPGDIGRAWVDVPGADGSAVQEVTARGDNVGTPIPAPRGSWVLTYLEGRFVLYAGGRLYRWEPRSGAVEVIGETPPPSAGNGRFVLIDRCDEALRCARSILDLATGEEGPLTGPMAEPRGYLPYLAVSTDGRYVADVAIGTDGEAAASGSGTTLRLLDRASGVVRQLRAPSPGGGDGVIGMEAINGLDFSADGRVLFFTTGSQLFAWVMGEPDPVPVDLGGASVNQLAVIPVS